MFSPINLPHKGKQAQLVLMALVHTNHYQPMNTWNKKKNDDQDVSAFLSLSKNICIYNVGM